MSKSRGKKILLVILVALALFVVLFVISCKTNLTRLEAELEEVEDMYFQAGYTDYRINSVILSAYTFGEWDALPGISLYVFSKMESGAGIYPRYRYLDKTSFLIFLSKEGNIIMGFNVEAKTRSSPSE